MIFFYLNNSPLRLLTKDDNFLETEDENFVMDDNDFLIKLKGVHGFHPGLSEILVENNFGQLWEMQKEAL